MKATELMIGDWVSVVHLGKKRAVRVTYLGTSPNEIGYDWKGEVIVKTEKAFEPIPLTAEILEENGFWYGLTTEQEDILGCGLGVPVTPQKSWVWENDEEAVVCVDFPNEADGGMVWCNNHEKTSSVIWVKGFSVHELQHAPRLCGLNEMADNFKVD